MCVCVCVYYVCVYIYIYTVCVYMYIYIYTHIIYTHMYLHIDIKSLFNNAAANQACNFTNIRLQHMFCEIFKNTYFEENLQQILL